MEELSWNIMRKCKKIKGVCRCEGKMLWVSIGKEGRWELCNDSDGIYSNQNIFFTKLFI